MSERGSLLIGIGQADDTAITADIDGFPEVIVVEAFLHRMQDAELAFSIGFEIVVIGIDLDMRRVAGMEDAVYFVKDLGRLTIDDIEHRTESGCCGQKTG
jgi:hypothetical protein